MRKAKIRLFRRLTMLKKSVEDALNKQANRELYSAYLYLSMSAYFESVNMRGFARWMRVQAAEERSHAMMFLDYIIQTGGRVKLAAIEAPKAEWKSCLQVFEEVYEHEVMVTGMIHDLVNLAGKEKDHATNNMLQWFVKEQVEEEEHSAEIVAQIRMIGDIQGHLFWLDHKLGERK
jgi:ferritin